MFELLLQESYADWILPITIAVLWILSWQLLIHSGHIQARRKLDRPFKVDTLVTLAVPHSEPRQQSFQLVKTVKRQESPDDSEGPHPLILKLIKF